MYGLKITKKYPYHPGKYYYGKIPMQTFLDALILTWDKIKRHTYSTKTINGISFIFF